MSRLLIISALLLTSFTCANAELVIFGSGANQFTMEFAEVGNPGNPSAAYLTWARSVGEVDHHYRIGKYEVSRDQFEKAGFGLSLADLSSYGGNDPRKPATGMNWYRALQFVNNLNTSKGYSPAYKFDVNGSFKLWTPAEAGFNSANQYRNTLAVFFLPNMDEWFKAGYYDPTKATHSVFGNYWNYANQSENLPTAVGSGTAQNSAVYGQPLSSGPAPIDNAGGLSYYGTMGQNGNASEWLENAYDGVNNIPGEYVVMRGGSWFDGIGSVSQDAVNYVSPELEPQIYKGSDQLTIGFRVAMIPEPSSLTLLALGGVALAFKKRRQA